jgi:hypothetical protein
VVGSEHPKPTAFELSRGEDGREWLTQGPLVPMGGPACGGSPSATLGLEECSEVRGGDADRVQDTYMCQLMALAKRVNRGGADAELAGDGGHGEQRALDPSWTWSFVLPRYGLGAVGSAGCGCPQCN